MKSTTEELLLALGVRELAVSRWYSKMPKNQTPEQNKEWKCAHPLNDMVKEVMQELEKISQCIKSIELGN